MDALVPTLLLWGTAISSALMAGIYFAFSGFIMHSLDLLGVSRAVAAMNAINTAIIRSSFMPLFFGSTLFSVLLVIAGLWHWGAPGSTRAVIAGTVYLVGMFIVTAVANVPLNNRLAAVASGDETAPQVWQHYLRIWTRWNSLRAAASTITFVLCLQVLAS